MAQNNHSPQAVASRQKRQLAKKIIKAPNPKKEIAAFKKQAGVVGQGKAAFTAALKQRASQPGHLRAKALLAAQNGHAKKAAKIEAARTLVRQARVNAGVPNANRQQTIAALKPRVAKGGHATARAALAAERGNINRAVKIGPKPKTPKTPKQPKMGSAIRQIPAPKAPVVRTPKVAQPKVPKPKAPKVQKPLVQRNVSVPKKPTYTIAGVKPPKPKKQKPPALKGTNFHLSNPGASDIELGKDGSKWAHGYIPKNAAAVALKAHKKPGGGSSVSKVKSAGSSREHAELILKHAKDARKEARASSTGDYVRQTPVHVGPRGKGFIRATHDPKTDRTKYTVSAVSNNGKKRTHTEHSNAAVAALNLHNALYSGENGAHPPFKSTVGPSNADKIKNAEKMYGTNSRQHKEAKRRFGGADLSVLDASARNSLSASSFVFPKTKRYPIPDLAHARNALARSSGKPEAAIVRAAVYKKFPQLKKGK